MERETLKCQACGAVFDEYEADNKLVFAGSTEEPREYALACPQCASTNVDVDYVVLCDGCERVQVQHDGDRCPECQTVEAERRCDDARLH